MTLEIEFIFVKNKCFYIFCKFLHPKIIRPCSLLASLDPEGFAEYCSNFLLMIILDDDYEDGGDDYDNDRDDDNHVAKCA